ncbi:hypothetical protein CLOHAE12215_02025 [Clostridium haemolyticum]|nr:hypothetical protein Z958_12600 [Clostridium novyi B str. NCTC 9691]CAG7840601.1 hypothetical protein CLOHAE12215_02025 [Clostridium haemolyticum]
MNNNLQTNLRFLSIKWVIFIIFPILIHIFITIKNSITHSSTVYDLILSTFNDYYLIFYILYLLFSILVLKVIVREGFDSYVYIRFKYRSKWFYNKIRFIGLIAFIYILVIIGLCILASIGHFGFSNLWSEFSKIHFKTYDIIFSFSPIRATLISSILLFMYLFTLGLIIFISSLFVKHNVFAFVIAFLINIINMLCFLCNIRLFHKIGFCHNTLLTFHSLTNNNLQPTIIHSFIYWIVFISILIFIGSKRINKMDLN